MIALNLLYDFFDTGFNLFFVVTFICQLSVIEGTSNQLANMALYSCGSSLGQRLNLFWFSARMKLFIAIYLKCSA